MPFQQALCSRLCAPVPPPAPPAPPAPLPRFWPCSRLRPHRRGPSRLRPPEMSSQALPHGLGSAQAVPPVCRFGIASSRGTKRWGRQREGPSVLLPLGRAVLGQTGPGERECEGLCTVRGLLLGGRGAVALSHTLGPLLCPLGSYVLVPCAQGTLQMQRGWQHLTTCFACTLLEPCRVVRASPGLSWQRCQETGRHSAQPRTLRGGQCWCGCGVCRAPHRSLQVSGQSQTPAPGCRGDLGTATHHRTAPSRVRGWGGNPLGQSWGCCSSGLSPEQHGEEAAGVQVEEGRFSR